MPELDPGKAAELPAEGELIACPEIDGVCLPASFQPSLKAAPQAELLSPQAE